jgi:hypothetical protein
VDATSSKTLSAASRTSAASPPVTILSGVAPSAFHFANAHRLYIYDAFAVSAAERKNDASDGVYRMCPVTTGPRVGDLICQQRESEFADASDEAVREHIRAELEGSVQARSVRRSRGRRACR